MSWLTPFKKILDRFTNLFYKKKELEIEPSPIDSIIKKEGGYNKNKLKHGKWIYEYESGQKCCEKTYDNGKQTDIEYKWYENGQKESEIPYNNDKMDGVWHHWHNNGKKKWETTYRNGRTKGYLIEWYKNGNKKYEGRLKDVFRVGEWTYYNEDGTVREVVDTGKK
jgi:antitoxin component YwqK of YwqJK toxin-antitoxin module